MLKHFEKNPKHIYIPILTWLVVLLAQIHVLGTLLSSLISIMPSSWTSRLLGHVVWAAILATLGWFALGKTQRVAWTFFCVVTAGAIVNAWLFDQFYGRVDQAFLRVYGMHSILVIIVPLLAASNVGWQTLERYVGWGMCLVILFYCLSFVSFYGMHLFGNTQLAKQIFQFGERPIMDSTGVYKDARRLELWGHTSNTLGAVLLVAWPALVRFLYRQFTSKIQFATTLAAIAITVYLVLVTCSRAAYIGLLIQTICLFASAFTAATRQVRKICLTAGIAVTVSIIGTLFLQEHVSRRITSLASPHEASVQHRMVVFSTAAKLLAERPLTGWGPGVFRFQYSTFYKIPGIDYNFPDVHSSILCSLLNIGVAGCAFFILAIWGSSWKRLFEHMPIWIWVSLGGVLVPLLSDNPTTFNHAVTVPLLCLAAVIATCAKTYESGRTWISWNNLLSACIWIAWLGCLMFPPLAPAQRLDKELKRLASRLSGNVAFLARHPSSGSEWRLDADTPNASVVAGIVALAHAGSSLPYGKVTVEQYSVAPGAPTQTFLDMTNLDLAAMLLSQPTIGTAKLLLGSVGQEELDAITQDLYATPIWGEAQFAETCTQCGTLDVTKVRKTQAEDLTPLATTATVRQLLNAYVPLVENDPVERNNDALKHAISHAPDEQGFIRHLQEVRIPLGLAWYLGSRREEVLVVEHGISSWSLACHYNSSLMISPRIDSAANRVFAEIAWRFHCYIDAYAGTMLSDRSSPDIESKLWSGKRARSTMDSVIK